MVPFIVVISTQIYSVNVIPSKKVFKSGVQKQVSKFGFRTLNVLNLNFFHIHLSS
jgi:hypothetical protein